MTLAVGFELGLTSWSSSLPPSFPLLLDCQAGSVKLLLGFLTMMLCSGTVNQHKPFSPLGCMLLGYSITVTEKSCLHNHSYINLTAAHKEHLRLAGLTL